MRRDLEAMKGHQKAMYQKDYLFLSNPAMQTVYDQIEQVSKQSAVTVLILGETGTGKEHVAKPRSMFCPPARLHLLWNYIAVRCPKRCWNPNYSDMNRALLRMPAGPNRGFLRWRTAAQFSWMRWESCL